MKGLTGDTLVEKDVERAVGAAILPDFGGRIVAFEVGLAKYFLDIKGGKANQAIRARDFRCSRRTSYVR